MRSKDTGSTRDAIDCTVTASQAYETMKAALPVLKAWEQTETLGDEEICYTLFDGTRLGRKRNRQIRMNRPQDMQLFLSPSWTKLRVYDHVKTAVDVTGTCRISHADADSFLKTGRLPGGSSSQHYRDLANDIGGCTDRSRRRHARYVAANRGYAFYTKLTRRDALRHVAERFREHQDSILQARVTHHMIGSRRGTMGIHRQVVHVLWRRMVDRDIALATLRAYGRKCTVADYNRVAKAWHIPCGSNGSRDRGMSTLRDTHRSAFILYQTLFPKKGGPPIAEAIQSVPQRLREITGSARLWRATMGWSDPQLLPVARLLGRMAGSVPYGLDPVDEETGRLLLEKIAERQSWPATVLFELSWRSNDDLRTLTPFLPVLHTAAVEARRRRCLRPFMSSYVLVLDMLRNLDGEDYDALAHDARNATWARLDERQAQWHRAMVAIRRQEMEAEEAVVRDWSIDDSWAPVLGSHVDDTGEATEIVDVRTLDQEALELEHCVDSYAPECISGISRIFSLRTGEHRSTLELRRQYGVWQIRQHYGFDNAIPDRSLTPLARSVTKAANLAERRSRRR